MRKLLLFPAAVFVAAVAFGPVARDAAAEGGAPAPTIVPTGRPGPVLPVAPFIKSGRIQALPGGKWTGEPLVFELDVVNPGNSPLTGSLDLQQHKGMFHPMFYKTQTSLNVPAGGTQTVTLKDGLPTPRCMGEITYDVWIDGKPESRMELKMNPSCSFTYTTDNPWDHIESDRVADAKNDALYYQNARVTVPPQCSKSSNFTLSADVVDTSKTPARGVTLTISAPPGMADLLSNPTPPFDTYFGTPQTGATVSEWFWGQPGPYTLQIAEKSGPKVSQPGFVVNVKQSCTVTTSFAKPAEYYQ
jgi:hypothetical protein